MLAVLNSPQLRKAILHPSSNPDYLLLIKVFRLRKIVTSLIGHHSLPSFRVLEVTVEVGMSESPELYISVSPARFIRQVSHEAGGEIAVCMDRVDYFHINAGAVMCENNNLPLGLQA
jgi:hypothetical protein